MKNFSTEALSNHAINVYKSTTFNDKSSNDFFEIFCPGQRISSTDYKGKRIYFSDQAYERFHDYEELLLDLYQYDQQKYIKIHKGTPFFFMAWISYFMRNFDQALFYLDAAISEDSKNVKNKWVDYPAGKFLLLQTEGHTAFPTVLEIRETLEKQFIRINKILNQEVFNIDTFINKFVRKLVRIKKNRTLISSLYTFFLEYPVHENELNLRSSIGGTIYPFIKHLFSGGVIFETLLKIKYPKNDRGDQNSNIGGILNNCSIFRNKYGSIRNTSSDSIRNIVNQISDNSLLTAFRITTMIRNTVGHNLIRDDAFRNKGNYKKLYEQEVNAILYFISREYF